MRIRAKIYQVDPKSNQVLVGLKGGQVRWLPLGCLSLVEGGAWEVDPGKVVVIEAPAWLVRKVQGSKFKVQG